MGSLIQHEIGHTMGHLHTGFTDSADGVMPVMTTCRPNFAALGAREFSQDDRQNHQRINGFLWPRSISANLGFADGVDFFSKTGGFWYLSGGELRFRRSTPGASGDKFLQRHVIAGSAGMSYDVRLDWDRVSSGVAATVWASMYARPVDYTTNTCGNPPPVAGHSYNNARTPAATSATGGTWYFKANGSNSVGASSSSSGTLITGLGSMTGNTVDIELRVSHSAASTSGGAQYIAFDDVRLRER